jgi:hypothetical protein
MRDYRWMRDLTADEAGCLSNAASAALATGHGAGDIGNARHAAKVEGRRSR